MLQVRNLSKSLGGFAIEDINFELPKGYIMGLIGVNGAGKTSLIEMLLGLTKPDAGEIFIDGKKVTERETKDDMGYVLSENYFMENLTVLENGALFGPYYSNYEEEVFCQYLQEFQVPEKKRLSKLSKGMFLRFQFAFALSHRPKLLIMDEALLNLDLEFRYEMVHKMQQFVEDGEHSILYATHLLEELDQIADYILMLAEGRQLFFMDKESLYDAYQAKCGDKITQQPSIEEIMIDVVKGGMVL